MHGTAKMDMLVIVCQVSSIVCAAQRLFGCHTESFTLTKEQLVVTGGEMDDAERGIIWSVVDNSYNPIGPHCKQSVSSVLGCIRAQELPRIESRTEQDSCKFAFIALRGY